MKSFFKKMLLPEWKPDYGPAELDARRGGTVIGARDFLVAYNVNLNTTSTRRANAIAFDVREAGRVLREGDPVSGKPVTGADGKPVHVPGTLKAVKAIGWYIEEYGMAQISMNLTNISVTPVHVAFDEVCRAAAERGIRVTGSELVGLIPLQAMLDAGRYFLAKQQRSAGVSVKELIRIAILSMGLDELGPFIPEERIIEYLLQNSGPAAERLSKDAAAGRLPMRRPVRVPLPAAAPSPPMWEPWALPSGPWWPTSRLTKKAGIAVGPNSAGGQRRDRRGRMSCCGWLMPIRLLLMGS